MTTPQELSIPDVRAHRPLLSVISPNFNHARYIRQYVHSILTQEVADFEYLILDDGSTDESVSILEELASRDPRISVLSLVRNEGVVSGLNRLLQRARGEFLYAGAFDDVITPRFLARSIDMLLQHPDAALCSTMSYTIDEQGKVTGLLPRRSPVDAGYVPPTACLKQLKASGSWIVGNTVVYRRASLVELGGFASALGPYCDGFIQELLAIKLGVCFIPEPLASWRALEGGYSRSTTAKLEETKRIGAVAKHMMESTFAAIVPPDYVRVWFARWTYAATIAAAQGTVRSNLTWFGDWQRRHGLDNAATSALLKAIGWMQMMAVRVYQRTKLRYFRLA